MKWFQLHSNSLYDPKIVRLIKKHGIRGFGIYTGINILIAEKDEETFTLEHDLDDLQTLFNDNDVEPVIETCIDLGLFTRKGQTIQNVKIGKYVGNWQKRTKGLQSPSVDPTEALQRPSVQKERKKEGMNERKDFRPSASKPFYNPFQQPTPKPIDPVQDHGFVNKQAQWKAEQEAELKAKQSKPIEDMGF